MRITMKGFTLIELMVVVVIIAILAAVALPSYQAYIQRSAAAAAQQEMLKLAEQLERHKIKNFTYKGFKADYLYEDNAGTLSANFDSSKQELKLPLGSTVPNYILSIMGFSTDEKGNSNPADDVVTTSLLTSKSNANLGQSWGIKAVSSDDRNYSFLLRSDGIRCKNKTSKIISYEGCGTKEEGSEPW